MKISAGILIYRKNNNQFEILLVHPGGPYWQNKNEGSWSIPKGEVKENDVNFLITAIREFKEETGVDIKEEDIKRIFYLGEVKSENKIVQVFCLEKDWGDNFKLKSKMIKIEWPPKSNQFIDIPEIDQIGYFNLEEAKTKLVKFQRAIIEIFEKKIDK
ncbi:MAG: NUDIX domain-containing protein [Patescibacteria group bacterium]|nr:NUDIX domain-containing protein [Patescibacteria group bacterium]